KHPVRLPLLLSTKKEASRKQLRLRTSPSCFPVWGSVSWLSTAIRRGTLPSHLVMNATPCNRHSMRSYQEKPALKRSFCKPLLIREPWHLLIPERRKQEKILCVVQNWSRSICVPVSLMANFVASLPGPHCYVKHLRQSCHHMTISLSTPIH